MPVELILEIGCEEIPARFVASTLPQLKDKAVKALDKARIGHREVAVYGTPRRLCLAVKDVEPSQRDFEEKKLGPSVAQAFDGEGKPTKAAQGFARSCGAGFDELTREMTPKGERLAYVKQVEGRPTGEVLPGLLGELIGSLEFGKSMRWGAGEMRFVRPIHWVLALLGGEVIDFALDGTRSGKITYGHRFTAPGPIEVSSVAEYLEMLQKADVFADPQVRRETIEGGLDRMAKEQGWEIYPDPGLLDEVTNLVECPTLIAGRIKERFLELPAEVLITAMRTHQRYFSVKKPGPGRELLPHFITVSNHPLKAEGPARDIIRRGNERVLGARLADAEFYWNEDRKTGIERMREATGGMIFYKTLGSYRDKTDRVEALAERLGGELLSGDASRQETARQAARLCKADLTSQMVGEFPELQGIMGGEYARAAGFPAEVAQAIRDHYLPRSAEDIAAGRYPSSPVGDVLCLADKVDSLVSCWAAGLAPTGAGDPFALRRQTQGVINLVLARKHRLDLPGLLGAAAGLIAPALKADPAQVSKEVLDFVLTRLKVQLTDAGAPYDVIDACLAVTGGDLYDASRKIEALARMKKRPDFDPLMIAFKRVMNIVEGEPGPVNKDIFEMESEAVLYSEYTRVEAKIGPLLEKADYDGALELMTTLKPAVDRFFDEVMVNVEDKEQRRNRHALCALIASSFKRLADFSKLVVEGDRSGRK